jgi:seryl-tRNA synthetase
MNTEETSVKVAEIDQRSKSNQRRLDKVEDRQDNLDALITSVATLATEQEYIKDDVKEIKCDVKTLTNKPGKRWDGLVDKVIWAVAAALIGFFLARIGL